jgi:hypothetical protein
VLKRVENGDARKMENAWRKLEHAEFWAETLHVPSAAKESPPLCFVCLQRMRAKWCCANEAVHHLDKRLSKTASFLMNDTVPNFGTAFAQRISFPFHPFVEVFDERARRTVS